MRTCPPLKPDQLYDGNLQNPISGELAAFGDGNSTSIVVWEGFGLAFRCCCACCAVLRVMQGLDI